MMAGLLTYGTQPLSQTSTNINVLIIAKSYSDKQLCILGFDGTRIIRLLNLSEDVQKQLKLFLSYNCNLDYNCRNAIFPHKNEDTIVLTLAMNAPLPVSPFILTNLAMRLHVYRLPISNTFKGLTELKYVHAGTNCPSATVFVCNRQYIRRYQTDGGKTRCQIKQPDTTYDFRYTGTREDDFNLLPLLGSPPDLPGRSPNFLIVLSLGRPFKGADDNPFNPPRCYVLVVGVHQI